MAQLTKHQLNEALDNALTYGMKDQDDVCSHLTNAERGGDCYTAVIKHRLSMPQARRLLEFFGTAADQGADPCRMLAEMVKAYKKKL